jgi:hypothetical protein
VVLSSRSRSLQPRPQLSLLLPDLHLHALDAVLERLPALADHACPQRRLAAQRVEVLRLLPAPRRGLLPRAAGPLIVARQAVRQPAGLQLGARLERLDAPRLAVQLGVGAVEQQRDGRGDLAAQRGLGGGESGGGDELVMLRALELMLASRLVGDCLLGARYVRAPSSGRREASESRRRRFRASGRRIRGRRERCAGRRHSRHMSRRRGPLMRTLCGRWLGKETRGSDFRASSMSCSM